MKILFAAVVAVVSLFFSVDTLASEKAIRKVMQMQQDAWNRGDMEAYMQGYWQSEELQFVGKNGIKKGWQTTLDNYKKSYPDKSAMGKLTFDILDVQMAEDSAFVLGKWALKREKDNPSGFYTLYWKLNDGQWKIVIDHSS